jgi:hypothetical protein
MARDWLELTKLTGGTPVIIERVRLADRDIHIEGEFELPPLARLSAEDQVFIMAFIRSDGSIKELEKAFGISYPTVKNRLARISQQFEFIEINPAPPEAAVPPIPPRPPILTQLEREEILKQLERGEITAAEAIERLSK